MKSELEKAYLETIYSVFIDEEQHNIKIGKALPLVIQKLVDKDKSAVILTAWNPKSQALSLSENHLRNSQLNSKLEDYNVCNAVGQGSDLSWQPEESFLIVGINKNDADNLALEFEQYAYVYCENDKAVNLVFTKFWYDLS